VTMMKFLGVATKSDDELLSLSSRGTPFQRRKKWVRAVTLGCERPNFVQVWPSVIANTRMQEVRFA
jgi:hypothetical protein